MTLITNLKRKDLWISQMYMSYTTTLLLKHFTFIILFYIGFTTVTYILNDEPSPLGFPISLLLHTFIFALIYPLIHFSVLSLNALFKSYKNSGVICEHTFNVTDDGLFEKTEYNETLHSWSGIDRVYIRGKYVIILLHSNQCHILPFRDFSSRGDIKKFKGLVEESIANATK